MTYSFNKSFPAILSIALIICCRLSGNTYQVGPDRDYTSPNALYHANVLSSGDTIEIDSAFYSGIATLAVWQHNNLVIRGVGGKPHLFADGQYIWGKGIWVCAGNNITVENIEFSGAMVPSNNGAGIRLDGVGLTVRNCFFHHNQNGILTNNTYDGVIIIEKSEFSHNGFGDGYTHNLYVGHCQQLILQCNYFHHAITGHQIKSRANENFILYNRIMDEETGTSSRLIDLPNGGLAVVMGNLLMQGEQALNKNLIGYGLEGLTNTAPHHLFVINNTCVNKRFFSSLFVDIVSGADFANISNNIFAGGISQEIYNGPVSIFETNLVDPEVANILFADEPNYNYHILSGSPAINSGTAIDPVNGIDLTPGKIYEHPAGCDLRINTLAIDIGAYEYVNPSANNDLTEIADFLLYPNPAYDRVYFQTSKPTISIKLFDFKGNLLNESANGFGGFSLEGLAMGIYLLVAEFEDNEYASRKILKR